MGCGGGVESASPKIISLMMVFFCLRRLVFYYLIFRSKIALELTYVKKDNKDTKRKKILNSKILHITCMFVILIYFCRYFRIMPDIERCYKIL